MALYTSTQTTPTGTVVNAVLNSVLNTITYTVTAPNGVVAVSTQDLARPGLRDIFTQLRTGGSSDLSFEITKAINNVNASVNQQATTAQTTAEVTGEPPPQESQAIPVSPTTGPQQQAFLDANAEPQTINEPDPVSQAFLDANAEPKTIPDPPFIDDQEADLLQVQQEEASALNVQPEVISDEEADLLQAQQEEGEAISAGLEKPPTVDFNDYGYDSEEDDNTEAVGTTDDVNPSGNSRGLQGQIENTRATATKQDQANYENLNDWRVILRLAEGSDYLYKNSKGPGILKPLADTNGVIFPYTPQIQVQYAANYDPTELTHTNYKIYNYKSSHVEGISITCDFTAQDTYEANYLLAVIHFFRSVTKMFYGQDNFPKAGTPPPLCYLTGLGNYQFNNHPLAITGFNYTLPNDVDYIRAYAKNYNSGTSNLYYSTMGNSRSIRLSGTGVAPGGGTPPPTWIGDLSNDTTEDNPTYVPTKIQIQVQAIPIISRLDISSRFSLEKYATGSLLLGRQNGKGGIW